MWMLRIIKDKDIDMEWLYLIIPLCLIWGVIAIFKLLANDCMNELGEDE